MSERSALTQEKLSLIVAEMRATELVAIVRDALDGAAQWRPRARELLAKIDAGELRE